MSAAVVAPLVKSVPDLSAFDVFPPHLRPGHLVTMQPVDAAHERAYYINDPSYCGQPKKDGKRIVIFATPDAVAYQSRSLAVWSSPSTLIDVVLRQTAKDIGPFILDAELFFYDVAGGEHRTAPQAAETNTQLGQPTAPTPPTIAMFEALYDEGSDLTFGPMRTRFNSGAAIVRNLRNDEADLFEFLDPVYTREAKQALADKQVVEGREGEVWRLTSASYVGGKVAVGRNGNLEPIVRTKHGVTRTVAVVGLTKSGATKVARLFAAIEVADPVTGARLGNVGTGFTQADQQAIVDGFAAAQAVGVPFLIEVYSRGASGATETGILYQASFEGIVRV